MKTPTITNDACMGDLEPGQLQKILDDFREAWNKPRPFWQWPEAEATIKTETMISSDEILEGFNGV